MLPCYNTTVFDLAQISSDLLRKPEQVSEEARKRTYIVGDKELTISSNTANMLATQLV